MWRLRSHRFVKAPVRKTCEAGTSTALLAKCRSCVVYLLPNWCFIVVWLLSDCYLVSVQVLCNRCWILVCVVLIVIHLLLTCCFGCFWPVGALLLEYCLTCVGLPLHGCCLGVVKVPNVGSLWGLRTHRFVQTVFQCCSFVNCLLLDACLIDRAWLLQCPLVTYRSGGNGHGCDDGDAMAMLVTMTVALLALVRWGGHDDGEDDGSIAMAISHYSGGSNASAAAARHAKL